MPDTTTVTIVLRKEVADVDAAKNVISVVETKLNDRPDIDVSSNITVKPGD